MILATDIKVRLSPNNLVKALLKSVVLSPYGIKTLPPEMAKLTDNKAVMVIMPERRPLILNLTCKKPVINPAAAPAIKATTIAIINGHPA